MSTLGPIECMSFTQTSGLVSDRRNVHLKSMLLTSEPLSTQVRQWREYIEEKDGGTVDIESSVQSSTPFYNGTVVAVTLTIFYRILKSQNSE